MNNIFTPPALELLKQKISQNILDAFNVMFPLTDASEGAVTSKQADAIKAYVELSGQDVSAVLNVSLSNSVAAEIAKAIDPDVKLTDIQMEQDITCEIANITAHAIRAYFMDVVGETLTASLPQVGVGVLKTVNKDSFSLQTIGKGKDAVSLDFSYSL